MNWRSLLIVGFFMAITQACLSGCGRKQSVQGIASGQNEPKPAGDSETAVHFRQILSPQINQFVYQNGRESHCNTILEIVGGGVACVDYDLDGHCDLFFPGGGNIDCRSETVNGAASLLLRGGPAFAFADTTEFAGASVANLYTHGATAADYNHDGFVDLLVYGYQGVRLLRNQGDGTFQDVTVDVGLERAPWTTAAGWGDLTGDGSLDLYLGSYVQWNFETHRVCPASDGQPDVCSPGVFAGSEDAFFISDDKGQFAPAQTGFFDSPLNGRALGVLVARFQSNEPLSIYVANDLSANFLLRRQSDGAFTDIGVAAGVAVDAMGNPDGSMGISLLDFHGDQRFDLLVTNFEHEQIAFYRNDGDLLFRHASRDVGLNSLDARVVGFGVVAADFSGDGREDVLLTSGHVKYKPDRGDIRQEPILLLNHDGQNLRRQLPECPYFGRKSCGRGVALADFDNDGDQDVVITHLFEPPVVLENRVDAEASWLRLRLVGRRSPRTPIGAIVTVKAGAQTMVRQLYGGGSYLSHSQPELFFHWPHREPAEVLIHWPNGQQQRLSHVRPRQAITVVEGESLRSAER